MRKNILFDMEGTLVDGFNTIDGIHEALEQLREQGHRLFIVTSALTTLAQEKIRRLHFDVFFERIYGCDLDGNELTKRDVISHVLRHHELIPHETIFVGDSDSDILSARSNHLMSVGVLWGFGSLKDFTRCGADFVLERPDQIAPLFATLVSIEKKQAANS